MLRLPYFDALLQALEAGDPAIALSFGRHVHWGYWPERPRHRPSDQEFAEAAERLSRLVCDAAGIEDGRTVVDAGCGFGGTIAGLNERHRHLRLIGVNLDPRQLQRARSLWSATSGNSIEWLNADACSMPIADASCDAVMAVECIFHFPSRRRFFEEARRVLKPGGRLSLSDFLSTPLLLPAVWAIKAWPGSSGFYGDCDLTASFRSYRQLAESTGFRVVFEADITRETLPTYDYLAGLWSGDRSLGLSAIVETLFAQWTSRLGALRYGVIAFERL